MEDETVERAMTLAEYASVGQLVFVTAAVDRALSTLIAYLLELPGPPAMILMDAVDIGRKLALISAMRGGNAKGISKELKAIEDRTRALIEVRNTVAHGSPRLVGGAWVVSTTMPNKALRFDPKNDVALADLPRWIAKAQDLRREILTLAGELSALERHVPYRP